MADSRRFFAVHILPGPAWRPGVSVFEQPLDDHVTYFARLHAEGALMAGGPFGDADGGLSILQVAGREEAARLMDDDPDVRRGVIRYELHEWCPIAWDGLAEGWVLYETPPLTVTRENAPRQRTS